MPFKTSKNHHFLPISNYELKNNGHEASPPPSGKINTRGSVGDVNWCTIPKSFEKCFKSPGNT